MVKEEIRGGICQTIHWHAKQIINTWEKNMIKTLNHYTSCI